MVPFGATKNFPLVWAGQTDACTENEGRKNKRLSGKGRRMEGRGGGSIGDRVVALCGNPDGSSRYSSQSVLPPANSNTRGDSHSPPPATPTWCQAGRICGRWSGSRGLVCAPADPASHRIPESLRRTVLLVVVVVALHTVTALPMLRPSLHQQQVALSLLRTSLELQTGT